MRKTKKIYVVTQGEYSDYGIVGIYSTEELAQARVDECNVCDPYSRAEIEVRPLDPVVEILNPEGKNRWQIVMFTDGDVKTAVRRPNEDKLFNYSPGFETGMIRTFEMYATDKEHAIKIANEMRIALKVKGDLDPGLKRRTVRLKDGGWKSFIPSTAKVDNEAQPEV